MKVPSCHDDHIGLGIDLQLIEDHFKGFHKDLICLRKTFCIGKHGSVINDDDPEICHFPKG